MPGTPAKTYSTVLLFNLCCDPPLTKKSKPPPDKFLSTPLNIPLPEYTWCYVDGSKCANGDGSHWQMRIKN